MNWAIMAHIVASITTVNAPPLYLPRGYAIANARIAPMPCSFAENGSQQVMFFWHLHVLPPIRGLLYLIRNKVDYEFEQIQATVFSNQICS